MIGHLIDCGRAILGLVGWFVESCLPAPEVTRARVLAKFADDGPEVVSAGPPPTEPTSGRPNKFQK